MVNAIHSGRSPYRLFQNTFKSQDPILSFQYIFRMIRTFFITEFELNTLFGEILNNLLTMHPNLNLRQRLFE